MDLGVLKGPAELLASRVKAFKNCLTLATECLTNKDYMNAEMIYGGILADLRKESLVETLNLNDLELFSLHSCFAYSSLGNDHKSEDALVILATIRTQVKLPLVPYLKAFVHMLNDRISFAYEEIESCQSLLNVGYNFKSNYILNEDIVPEINDDFMKLKVNEMKVACEILQRKEDSNGLKKCFKENWLQLGKLCESDFSKIPRDPQGKALSREIVEIRLKRGNAGQSGAVKKTEQCKTANVAVQTTTTLKRVNVAVQTTEKDGHQQLFAAVLDIRNKMNNIQNKKDNEIKQLQKKNCELNEKLQTKDNKRQEKWTEFEFLRNKYDALENKCEQLQKENEFLQKLLIEQIQQKYYMQKNVYQIFEQKCELKIEYLNDIEQFLNPIDRPTPDDCKQEVSMWKNTLEKISEAKKNFEIYYRTIDELIIAHKYGSIKTHDWPAIPPAPNDIQDTIHKNFKIIIQHHKSVYNAHLAKQHATPGNNVNNFRKTVQNPNYFANNHSFKEDGRTTGSPPYFRPNFPNFHMNGHKEYHHPKQFLARPLPPPNTVKKLNYTPSPPSPVSNESAIYQTEKNLLKFLQSNFENVGEDELLSAIFQVRDENGGGTLENYPQQNLINDIKRVLKKKTKPAWKVTQNEWQNDHSETRCCICFEDYDDATSYSLPCQHEFHKECITNWLKRKSLCPVCRIHAVIDEEFPPLKA